MNISQYRTRSEEVLSPSGDNRLVTFELDRLAWVMSPLLPGYKRLFLDTERKPPQSRFTFGSPTSGGILSMIIPGEIRVQVFLDKKLEKGGLICGSEFYQVTRNRVPIVWELNLGRKLKENCGTNCFFNYEFFGLPPLGAIKLRKFILWFGKLSVEDLKFVFG